MYNKSPIQRMGGGGIGTIIDTIHCPLPSPQYIREPWTRMETDALSKGFHRLSAYN